MQLEFEQFLGELLKGEKNHRFVLAISGGVDSMVLWHLFRQSSHPYIVAHCNFKMRGNESEKDEYFVREHVRENEIFESTSFDTKAYARANKLSIQMAARELRYRWFDELRAKHQHTLVATAHHMDDQTETFFVQLLRGGSMASMAGIPARTDTVVRPLLFATKKEIVHYAKTNHIKFRYDSSNDADDYLRNRVRHHIMPVIAQHFPDFQWHVMSVMYEIDEWHGIQRKYLHDLEKKLVHRNEEFTELMINEVKALEEPVLFLKLFLRQYGFHPDVADMVYHALDGQSGKVFESHEFRLVKDRNRMMLYKKALSVEFHFWKKDEMKHLDHPMLEATVMPLSDIDKMNGDPNMALVDYDKLGESITFRKWKRGDYFYPLGMKGKKKLSDFFTDIKLAIPEKDAQWLMTSDHEICWLPGLRLDDRFKITPETKTVLKLRFKEEHGE